MSQNPYSPNAFGTEIVEPPRTSLSAIGSLVTSLLCCIPGAGILATLLGAFAIVRIGSSGGRKSGKFLAIAGIVIGLLVTAIWLGVIIGAVSIVNNVNTNIIKPMDATFSQLGTGDKSALTALIDTKALPADGRAQADRFWAEVTAKHGKFIGFPKQGFTFESRGSRGQGNGPGNLPAGTFPFPLPVQFEKGDAIMMFLVDETKLSDLLFGRTKLDGIVKNIWVMGEDASVIELLPKKPADPALPAPSTPSAPDAPAKPAAPAGGA